MDNLDDIVEHITATAEVMGHQVSGSAVAIMAEDLAAYPLADVLEALGRVRRECQRFTLAAVIERIPNGWPGAEEAWATFPKDEAESGVVTQEALAAWAVALSLWEYGDKVGARMAFKETYEKAVAKVAGTKPPEWVPTLGYDRDGREPVIRRAIEQGKLTKEQAKHLLPAPIHDDNGPIVALITGKVSHIPQDRKVRARLAELRRVLDEQDAENADEKQA